MKKALFLIFLILCSPLYAFAGTCGSGGSTGSAPWTADSCSYADVNACVNTHASAEETINVPSGTATWSSTLEIAEGIYLIGAGIDTTTITCSANPAIHYDGATGQNYNFRISGFTFDLNGSGKCIVLGAENDASTDTPQTKVRIDHIKISNSDTTRGGVDNYNYWGVIDNCQFIDIGSPFGAWGDDSGTTNWDRQPGGLDFGELDDNMYVEDCIFTGVCGSYMWTDSDQQGRWAFRYNTVTLDQSCYNFSDIHPTCFGAECYGNRINASSYDDSLVAWRGGRLIAFYNDIICTQAWDFNFYNNDGADIYTIAAMEHNNGYVFINRLNTTGNLLDVSEGQDDANTVTINVTYWKDNANHAADPLTTGIGCGTLANIPAECTTGTAYWATNQSCSSLSGLTGDINTYPSRATIAGTLYKCTSTDTWTAYFTPMTYPHPLRSEITAALTGTYADGATEAEVVAGAEGLVITLTGDTWQATMGTNVQLTKDLIAGIDSGGSEAAGWDVEVKGDGTNHLTYADVTRTSDTIVTIDFPAEASYSITTNETITVTVPASALTGDSAVVATPTFEITATSDPAAALTGTFADNALEAEIVTGGETIIITLTNDTWVAAGATFDGQRQAIINGIDSAQSEATGWDAEVKAKEVVTAVVRTNSTVVTITLSAAAAYDISANETVTVTVPAAALVTSESPVVATPTSDIIFFDVSTEKITGITMQ